MENNIIIYNILQIVLLNIITKKLFSNKIKKSYKINKNIIKILKINKANFIKIYSFLLFYEKIYISQKIKQFFIKKQYEFKIYNY